MSKQFKELSKKSVFDNELDILKKWKEEDILNKTIKNRDNKENKRLNLWFNLFCIILPFLQIIGNERK